MMPMVSTWGRKVQSQTFFLSSRELSLSSVSGQKDCLTLLRCLSSLRSARQPLRSVDILSFFPTTSESESSLSEIRIRLRLYSFPGHTFGTMEEYIFHEGMMSTVVCKMYLTVVSFSSISQDILKVSKHAIYQKEAL